MSDIVELIKTFFKSLRDFRLKFVLKSLLNYYGIKNYSTIKYPFINISVTVRTSSFWKELERGHIEPNCIKQIVNVVRKGQVIFDVGAYIGTYTLLLSKLVRDTGRVYAFEPDPKAFDILRDNKEKNGLSNVRIQKVGMSNSIGTHKLRGIQFGDSSFSLIERKNLFPIGQLREIVIETTTIDRYCKENDIYPDGIKIDVEGAEALVIDGCRNIIEKYSPWILLEFHGNFMTQKERRTNWHRIVDSAKEVLFMDGNSNRYYFGSKVESSAPPDCLHFHVFIKY